MLFYINSVLHLYLQFYQNKGDKKIKKFMEKHLKIDN